MARDTLNDTMLQTTKNPSEYPRDKTSGAEDGIRTRDLLLGKEMLYH